MMFTNIKSPIAMRSQDSSGFLVPRFLVQPHMASLGMTFYPERLRGTNSFPSNYGGYVFAAEHGSWNRAARGGYEVIAAPVENGQVWGRPVAVAVGKDGSLYVTDDGSRSVWRVTYTGTAKEVASR